ncbi:DUF2851 family protein [Lacihabitans lacunae]|uniref:DUF2851 family protein n=1 Tax=Lacihabitans lacunae TaxID=1028214 RepID=A0ABV7Z4L4_9BACT
MKEDFLHYVWQYQLFDKSNLKCTDGSVLSVLKTGTHNTNSGPDFINARISLNEILWAGQVEIHIKSSDWNSHKHNNDVAYDNVVLHVVWEENQLIERTDKSMIPTLELKNIVSTDLVSQYKGLVDNSENIACRSFIGEATELNKISMLDNALARRLNSKTEFIKERLAATNFDWEEVAYQILGKNYGFKLNADAFLHLAEVLPLKILQKHRGNLFQIEALCFGQAGFLEEIKEEYQTKLKEEYTFLAKKYGIESKKVNKQEWRFLRTRPSNFPTLRIAQFASLINSTPSIFSFFKDNVDPKFLSITLSNPPSEYWQEHYDFGKKSAKKNKGLGISSVYNVLINTGVNLLAAYSDATNNRIFFEQAVEVLEHLKPEDNHITRKWADLGIEINSAFDSQALIEQYNNYCCLKKCLSCSIGVAYLKN